MNIFFRRWSVQVLLTVGLILAGIFLDRWMWIVAAVLYGWLSVVWSSRYGSCRLPRKKR